VGFVFALDEECPLTFEYSSHRIRACRMNATWNHVEMAKMLSDS